MKPPTEPKKKNTKFVKTKEGKVIPKPVSKPLVGHEALDYLKSIQS